MEELRRQYEEFRASNAFTGNPQELYDPVNYIMNLGGKRFRPLLTILGYRLFREDWQRVLPVAHALEIFHNFSLVHDDIMDEAPLRRGQPTVHTRWDNNTAILSGDVMLILAYDALTRFDEDAKIPRLVRTFNRVAREVCEGQQLDMNFECREDVAIDEYLRMIELKTSVLLATCLEMGAIAAGAPEEAVQHCYELGVNIGIAFQLQDDLLDTFGTADKVGKRIGGDIAQNKKTFLILKARELANGETARRLGQLMTEKPEQPDAKIKEVTALLQHLDIPQHTQAIKNEYRAKAFHHLEQLQVPAERKQTLQAIMENLVKREY